RGGPGAGQAQLERSAEFSRVKPVRARDVAVTGAAGERAGLIRHGECDVLGTRSSVHHPDDRFVFQVVLVQVVFEQLDVHVVGVIVVITAEDPAEPAHEAAFLFLVGFGFGRELQAVDDQGVEVAGIHGEVVIFIRLAGQAEGVLAGWQFGVVAAALVLDTLHEVGNVRMDGVVTLVFKVEVDGAGIRREVQHAQPGGVTGFLHAGFNRDFHEAAFADCRSFGLGDSLFGSRIVARFFLSSGGSLVLGVLGIVAVAVGVFVAVVVAVVAAGVFFSVLFAVVAAVVVAVFVLSSPVIAGAVFLGLVAAVAAGIAIGAVLRERRQAQQAERQQYQQKHADLRIEFPDHLSILPPARPDRWFRAVFSAQSGDGGNRTLACNTKAGPRKVSPG